MEKITRARDRRAVHQEDPTNTTSIILSNNDQFCDIIGSQSSRRLNLMYLGIYFPVVKSEDRLGAMIRFPATNLNLIGGSVDFGPSGYPPLT